MKEDIKRIDDDKMCKEKVRVGKTVYALNHIFKGNQTKQDIWLTIITRAEQNK